MVDREKLDKLTLINLLDDITKKYRFDAWENTDKIADRLIAKGVTIQKRGKWRLNKDGSGTCSECHRTQNDVWDYDTWQRYCGDCGAKMDGEPE